MPIRDYPPQPTLRDLGGGGNAVAQILMENARAQGAYAQQAGERWQNVGSAVGQAVSDFGKRKDDQRVQQAMTSAAGGGDVNSIIQGLPPELQGRAMQAIQAFDEQAAKGQKARLEMKELQQKIAQHDTDAVAVGAFHALQFGDQPDGGLGADTALYLKAKKAGIDTSRFEKFLTQAHEQFAQAQEDPAVLAKFREAYVAQRTPILRELTLGGSAEVADKLKPETTTLKTRDAAGNETEEIVAKVPGVKRTSAPPIPADSFDKYVRATYGATPNPAQMVKARAEWAAAGRDPEAAAARADAASARRQGREDTRLDRSFQFNSAELERTAKPLTDQAERFGRLVETVNQKTPQADALIAPELLTVMAGGSGSGLRMNEAEISRVIGGRTAYEGLKAALNKYSLDPSKGLSVTDAQREQIKALIGTMHTRISAKAEALNAARQELIDADTVEGQRQAMAKLKRTLSDTGTADTGKRKNPFR